MAQLNGGSTVAGNEIIHEGNFEEKGIAKQSDVDDINATIGTATLSTTDKTLKGAINEVRESVTSGGSVDNANKLNNQPASYYLNYTNLTNKPTSMPANGGNADTVDNKHASDFAPSNYGLGGNAKRLLDNTDLNTIIDNGWYDINNPKNGVSGLGWHKLFVINSGDSTDYYITQLAFTMNNGTQGSMYIRERRASIGWSNWIKVIDENGFSRIDISNKTVDLNDITLANGIVTNQYYIEKTNGGSSNISNIPVTDNPFILNVELIRWASASDYITKQTCISSGTKRIYERFCSSGTWTSWTQIAKTSDIPTSLPANGGNSATVNNHTASGTPSTTEKTDIIKMINEVFNDVNNGKTSIYNAIIDKGITPSSQTFADLSTGIENIRAGYEVGDNILNANVEFDLIDNSNPLITSDSIITAMAITNSYIWYGTNSGWLYCYDLDGNQICKTQTLSAPKCLEADDTYLYDGQLEGIFCYKIDGSSTGAIWYKTDISNVSSIASMSDAIVVGYNNSSGKTLRILTSSTGEEQYSNSSYFNIQKVVSDGNQTIACLFISDSTSYCINRLKNDLTLDYIIVTSGIYIPNITMGNNGVLYYVNANVQGQMYVYHIGSEYNAFMFFLANTSLGNKVSQPLLLDIDNNYIYYSSTAIYNISKNLKIFISLKGFSIICQNNNNIYIIDSSTNKNIYIYSKTYKIKN